MKIVNITLKAHLTAVLELLFISHDSWADGVGTVVGERADENFSQGAPFYDSGPTASAEEEHGTWSKGGIVSQQYTVWFKGTVHAKIRISTCCANLSIEITFVWVQGFWRYTRSSTKCERLGRLERGIAVTTLRRNIVLAQRQRQEKWNLTLLVSRQ